MPARDRGLLAVDKHTCGPVVQTAVVYSGLGGMMFFMATTQAN